MMCLIQIGLMVLGISLLKKRQIRVGGQVARQPTPFFVAMPLILQLPLTIAVGFLAGVSEGMAAAKAGKTEVSMREFQEKYWWIDIAVPTAGAALAGVMLAFGLKDADDAKPSEDELLELQLANGGDPDAFLARHARRDDPRRRDEDEDRPRSASRGRERDRDQDGEAPRRASRARDKDDDLDVWKFKS